MTSTVLPKSMSRHSTWKAGGVDGRVPATMTPLPSGRRVPRQSGQVFLISACPAFWRWAPSSMRRAQRRIMVVTAPRNVHR
ncbi:hypothetical protein ADK74_09885 [Streptomyces decoyicus]|nr:hypothetical protein ADK74_09885 [Streptomyces decoyicus]